MVKEQSKPYRKKENCFIFAASQIKAREKRLEVKLEWFYDFLEQYHYQNFNLQRECRDRGVPNERSVKSYIDTHMYSRRIKKRSFAFGQFNTYLMDQVILGNLKNILVFYLGHLGSEPIDF